MKYDTDKVDDMTLALLFLVTTGRQAGYGARAWKGLDANTLGRLYKKGWIENPNDKSLSLRITEEGYQRAEQLFQQHFAPQA